MCEDEPDVALPLAGLGWRFRAENAELSCKGFSRGLRIDMKLSEMRIHEGRPKTSRCSHSALNDEQNHIQ